MPIPGHNRIVRYGNVMTMSRNSVIALCLCSKSQGRHALQGLCTSCKMEPIEVWHAYQLCGQHGSLHSGRESKGKGERGRGVQMQDETRRTENRERRTEKDSHSAAGSRVVTQSGITHGNEGDEAMVAFYPDLLMTGLDQGIYTTTATLCAK